MYVKFYKKQTDALVDEGYAEMVDNSDVSLYDVYWIDKYGDVTHTSTYSVEAHYFTAYKEKPE